MSESSKVGRRRFLKYVGAGVVAAAGAGAGYHLYSRRPSQIAPPTVTIPKGWETAPTYLHETSTEASLWERYDIPEPRPVGCPFDISAAYVNSFQGDHPRDTWSNYHLHPLLGYYRADDPWIADWHIKWAVEHGVNTFAVHFLEHASWGKPTKATQNLNNGFLKAKYLDYVHFPSMTLLSGCSTGPSTSFRRKQKILRRICVRTIASPRGRRSLIVVHS